MEDEKRKKQLEYIKIKEWEENFDKKQKEKEIKENLKELKLRQKDLEKNKEIVNFQDEDNNPTFELEKFDINKTTKN